jgi:hypothetical protein
VSEVSEKCEWLHARLEFLPLIQYPFDVEALPLNGIYFFYEEGETWGHGGDRARIVRIGAHRGQDRLPARISEHFLLDENRMAFNCDMPKPADRSIFRLNIGRALLNRAHDPYLGVWEINFIPKQNRERFRHLRDIDKERESEREVTRLLRSAFAFRVVAVDDAKLRRGSERSVVGTIAQCALCIPSPGWLGRHSPKDEIRDSGLWQVQYLEHQELDTEGMNVLEAAMGS